MVFDLPYLLSIKNATFYKYFLRFSIEKIREIEFKNHLLCVLLTSFVLFSEQSGQKHILMVLKMDFSVLALSMVGFHWTYTARSWHNLKNMYRLFHKISFLKKQCCVVYLFRLLVNLLSDFYFFLCRI